jgi:hypothetical protein
LQLPPLLITGFPLKPLLFCPFLRVVQFKRSPVSRLGFFDTLVPVLDFSQSSIGVDHAKVKLSIPMLSAFAAYILADGARVVAIGRGEFTH